VDRQQLEEVIAELALESAAEIFQNERLASDAHDEPVTLIEPHLVRCTPTDNLCARLSDRCGGRSE
jgi:hypothetical protein